MRDTISLTEIFMAKARARILEYGEISSAIQQCEDTIQGSAWSRKWRKPEVDIRTFSGVSDVAVKMLAEKGIKSTHLYEYQDYMARAERIVSDKRTDTDFDTLQELQFEKNCQKLECNANKAAISLVLDFLIDKRSGEIAEKDLKAAFRALDRSLKPANETGVLNHYMRAQRDDIVREIRGLAIISRREYKSLTAC